MGYKKPVCRNGHTYTKENTKIDTRGSRVCLDCQKSYGERTPLRNRLFTIRSRCRYPSCVSYKNYGARGIKCFLKLDDMKFLWERDRADLMEKPTIDRIDINGHYTVENCRFIESWENTKFKRTTKLNYEKADAIRARHKEGVPLEEIAKEFGINKKHVSKVVARLVWNRNQKMFTTVKEVKKKFREES